MSKLPVTAVVLTYNESKNLRECLESISNFVDEILIVDSFSDDDSLSIAQRYTDRIFQNRWINYSKQFQWALHNTSIKNEWVLRIDADERWTREGFEELKKYLNDDEIDGVYVKMKIFFMGRWIRYGGFYPNHFLRVFRKSKSRIENRWMDEHIKVEGRTVISAIDVLEMNYDRQENISLWTEKHNNYSSREAVEYLCMKYNLTGNDSVADLTGNATERKRWLKENFYYRLPMFLRPFLYYLYRYFFKLGFLDGKEGLIFHFLQGFWYRFLVDVKIFQIEKLAGKNPVKVRKAIYTHFKIEV